MKSSLKELLTSAFGQGESARLQKSKTPDYQLITLVTVAAFCLVFVEYFASLSKFIKTLEGLGAKSLAEELSQWLSQQKDPKFVQQIVWVLGTITGFLLMPVLLISSVFRQRLGAFGWRLKASKKDLRLYTSFLLFMLPLVYLVSFSPAFRAKYPFYKPNTLLPNWQSYFIVWEMLYLLQFIAVEFFFRGFLLHGTKRQLGFYSIWLSMLPYCMIHFYKPLPETIGAIIAGIVLGMLSLKSNSIWLGVALHVSVALTMDLLALAHMGYLF